MFTPENIVTPAITMLSLLTMSGIMVHENQIDNVARTALHRAAKANDTKAPIFTSKPHTHSERPPLDAAVREVRSGQSRLQPRRNDNRANSTSRKSAQKDSYSEHPVNPILEAIGY